jgi:hypothetical protein
MYVLPTSPRSMLIYLNLIARNLGQHSYDWYKIEWGGGHHRYTMWQKLK